jgi:hypothetical protein
MRGVEAEEQIVQALESIHALVSIGCSAVITFASSHTQNLREQRGMNE